MNSRPSTTILNDDLGQLKSYLDHLESYDPNQNIGFRSLKNLSVWLLVFALVDKATQDDVLNKVTTEENLQSVRQIISSLTTLENLALLIADYEKANGKLTLKLSDDMKELIFAKATELGLLALVQKYYEPNPDFGFVLEMKNNINFSWAVQIYDFKNYNKEFGYKRINIPYILNPSMRSFANEEKNIPFLTSENIEATSHRYSAVKLDEKFYHVSQLHALQGEEKNKQETSVYFIQAEDANDQVNVPYNYLQIIKSFTAVNNNNENLSALLTRQRAHAIPELSVTECLDQSEKKDYESRKLKYSIVNKFETKVHFPELAEPLKTEEHRLGIYEFFNDGKIGEMHFQLAYTGKRELLYDKAGGEVRNLESCSLQYESGGGPIEVTNNVTMDYSYNRPFTLIYITPEDSDFYPFQISNPRKDLAHTFGASERYSIFTITKSDSAAATNTVVTSHIDRNILKM